MLSSIRTPYFTRPSSCFSFGLNSYRFSFNGKENDNEVEGDGNWQEYGMRMYSPRLGRFPNVDPISKQFPQLTPYQFSANSPVENIDLDGLEPLKNGYVTKDMREGNTKLNVSNSVSLGTTDPSKALGKMSTKLNTPPPQSEKEKPAGHVESFSAGFAFVGGLSLEYGTVTDTKGNSNKFFNVSGNIGFGLGAGFNSKDIFNQPGNDFKASDYAGSGFSFSGNGSIVGVSKGGNIDSRNGAIGPQILVGGLNYREESTTIGLSSAKSLKASLGGYFSIGKTKLISDK